MWRNIIILTVLFVLPALGYTAYWWHLATELEVIAEKNLEEAKSRFANVDIDFTYEDMLIVGYPSMPIIQISSPVLTRKTYGSTIYVSADELIVEPDDGGNTTFRVLLPKEIHASNRSPAGSGEFNVSADFVPKLTVRTAAGYTEESKAKGPIAEAFKSRARPPSGNHPKDIVYEYALNMPKNMRMTVTKGGDSVDIGFQWPLVPYRIWQPIRYDVGGSMDLFFAFLQEAEEKM